MEIRFANTGDIPRMIDLLQQVGEVHHQIRPDLFRAGAQKYDAEALKKLLAEAGIPPEQRDSLALLSDDQGLLWAEGFGCDERVAAVCPLQGDHYWKVCIEGKDYD